MSTHTIKSLFTGICLVFFSAASMAAQTCTTETEIPNLHPDSRYTNHGDGTVTDKETGLMWKQCLEGLSGVDACDSGTAATYTWQQALALPVALNGGSGFAGHSDWRLPNVTELESLVTQNCFSPSINLSLFPSDPGAWVWPSSPYANSSFGAWSISFGSGYTGGNYRGNLNRVRLVRSGQ